tara:strand:- start:359 stop:1780 length:1422 start_codon:yes stop_codon:yes gene_type:complete
MAFVINDRVKETTTTTGTGTLDLGGAQTGFETFVAGIGNTNTTYYCITLAGSNDFEVGLGTVTDASTDTLSRDTILSSSNGDAAVNFGAGTKTVFCTLPAAKAIVEDGSNNISVGNNITVGGTVDGVDIASRDTVLTNTTTTANAALPKAGGTMTGNITFNAGQATGNSGLVPAAGTSGHFLAHNGAFSQVAYGDVSGTPSVPGGATGLDLNDDVKIRLGASQDLEIFHEVSSGFNIFKDNSAGTTTRFLTDSFAVNNAADNKTLFVANNTNGVDLYFDNTKRAETTSTGFTVVGTLSATTISGALSGNISQFTNNSGYLTQVTSGGATTVSAGNGIGLNTGNGTITMSGSYSGSFSATGNITAYSSDERLKNFHGKIENALDKVDQLNGYYYEWNDVAKDIDEDAFKDGIEVGVSAQEIEKVLPEIVTKAPIVDIHSLDTNYKTVYYDKIVPLLIEAIKELKAEIEELKKVK